MEMASEPGLENEVSDGWTIVIIHSLVRDKLVGLFELRSV